MCIAINVIESCTDILDCMTVGDITLATLEDEHLGILPEYVLCSSPLTKAEVEKDQQSYWSF